MIHLQICRRASHGVQGRLDHRGKKFNTQDADGWRKKPLAVESTGAVSALNLEPSSNVPVQDHLPSVIAAEKYVINLQEKDEGESLTPMFDPSDCQEQVTFCQNCRNVSVSRRPKGNIS